jgi:transposase
MLIALHQLPDDIDALKSLVAEQQARNEQLVTENQRYKVQVLTLTEQLNLAIARRYAASSEKISADQIFLFDEAEAGAGAEIDEADPSDDAKVTVVAHQRKQRGRKPIPDILPRIEVIHELAESERCCDHDGRPLSPGGHLKFPHPWPGQNPPVDGDGTVCVYAL